MNVENMNFGSNRKGLCVLARRFLSFFHALDYKSRDVYITFKIAFCFDLSRQ
jgi:hypothetical protein